MDQPTRRRRGRHDFVISHLVGERNSIRRIGSFLRMIKTVLCLCKTRVMLHVDVLLLVRVLLMVMMLVHSSRLWRQKRGRRMDMAGGGDWGSAF